MFLDADTVFRDHVVKGDIHSGEHKPDKPEIRSFLKTLAGAASNPSIVKSTQAALVATVPANENYGGLVLNDPDPTKNGLYYRSGAAWVKGRGMPDSIAEVTLSGTANAQTGTASGVNPADVVIFFAVVSTENTGPMTLSVSGETARDVVNAAGNALSAGEWTGTVMFFLNSDGDYQLLIDAGAAAAAAASASAADADRIAAELARDQAQAAASSVSPTEYPTIADAEALTPASAPDFIRTAGYAAAGDGGGALYKKVASEPTHAGKFSITLVDGVTVVWYEISEPEIAVEMFGASSSASAADNFAAIDAARSLANSRGLPLVFGPGPYDFAATITFTGNDLIFWNNTVLVKQFDGDGVIFQGGSSVIYTHGRLMVQKGAGGSGPAAPYPGADAVTAGVNDADRGIVLKNRMINFGELIAWYHQGDGIHISARDNMNSARFGYLRSQFNGGHGIGGSGTQDDCSLITMRARTFGNWKSGLYLPDSFPARSWMECFITSESNQRDGVSAGIYLGNAYGDGNFKLYSENQTDGSRDIEIGANTRYINIQDMRVNSFINNSTRPWSINLQQKTNLMGNTPQEGFVRGGSVTITTDNRYISKLWVGSGETAIMERRIFGNGSMHFIPYAGEAAKVGFTNTGDLELFGTNKAIFMKSANGTRYRLRVSDAGALTITAIP